MFRRTQSVKRDLVTGDVTLKGRGLMHRAVSSILACFLSPVFSYCNSFDRPLIPANIDSFANIGFSANVPKMYLFLPLNLVQTFLPNFPQQRAR